MSERVHIRLEPLGEKLEVAKGTPLREVLFSRGVEFPCGGQGYCNGCRVRVLDGDFPVTDEQRTCLSAEELAGGWRLACCGWARSDLTLEIGRWAETILADDSSFAFVPREGFGIAADIGTTTLAVQLLDLRTARVLAVETALNPQGIHGSDIMSRVQFALTPDGRDRMRELIQAEIGAMIGRLAGVAGVALGDVTRVTLVGNTVMHHLFCGIDAAPLSVFPFETPEPGARILSPGEVNWPLTASISIEFLPCIGGFVGSDILAGILATRLYQTEKLSALVDLGTNGEIVIGNRYGMLCASAAAGPAFEGARISMGMRATTGAISEAKIQNGGLVCGVIGGESPRGLCGSGLVDVVACGVELRWIQPGGRLSEGRLNLDVTGPVKLSQRDVRELQLAKGAIAAGLRLLLKQRGVTLEELSTLHLAGAFGNYINRTSARRIGLFDSPESQIHAAGNTALLGAKMALYMDADEIEPILRKVEHVQLAADPEFQQAYVEAMAFPAPAAT